MRENKTCRKSDLKQMSTEALDDLLDAELQKKTPDAEVVLPILHELEEREENYPTEVTENIANAWEKFKEKAAPKKPHRKKSWIVGVAAAVFLVIVAMPQTVGAESLLDVLFRWTASVFEFLDPEQNKIMPQVDDTFITENPGLQQVYDEMTRLGVTLHVVPMWLPEGFDLTEIKVVPMLDGQKLIARFQKNDSFVALSYRIASEIITAKFEKEDTAVDVYEYEEVSHFIMENEENLSVAWVAGSTECSVTTNVDKDTVYNLIKSIYGRIMP